MIGHYGIRERVIHQRGVALVLVLMITAVLGLLMLQIGLTAREQVSRASQLIDRAEAELRLRSANATLLYSLATEPWQPRADLATTDAIAQAWNFHGESFTVNGAQMSLQDVAGFIPAPQPGDSTEQFRRVLSTVGVESSQARAIADRLAAHLAASGGVPLQDLRELPQIAGLEATRVEALARFVTVFPTTHFNPATAPREALATEFSGSILDGLEALRKSGTLDDRAFFTLTGRGGDEFYSTAPGPSFKISVRVTQGRAVAAEEQVVTIDPYARDPFVVWSRGRAKS